MKNIFLQTYREEDGFVFIEGRDCHYLKNVRRVKKGDTIRAVLGGKTALLLVSGFEKGRIICTVVKTRRIMDGNIAPVTVYQGLLKAGKMDNLVARLAELDVRSFIPLVTSRSIPRGNTGDSRIERWRRLSLEGAKVSGSERPMEVSSPVLFTDVCRILNKKENEVIIIFCTGGLRVHVKSFLDSISGVSSFYLFFGPEGGFTAEEVQAVREIGGTALTMGTFVMKSDTAALVGTGFIRIYYSGMIE